MRLHGPGISPANCLKLPLLSRIALGFKSTKLRTFGSSTLKTQTKERTQAYADRGVLVNIVSPTYVVDIIIHDLLAQQDGAEGVSPD